MVILEKLSGVSLLLMKAAKSEATVSYGEFHKLFDRNAKDCDKYDTLEAACRAIVGSGTVIYSALMSKKVDSCPGDGFFDVFKNRRSDKYTSIAGRIDTLDLKKEMKQEVVGYERQKVYEHAKTFY